MLSRLQPAFILIPPVETSQGGSSSPLSCPPLPIHLRWISPFASILHSLHKRARTRRTHTRTHRCRSGLSFPFPPPATLHASYPRPYPPPCPLLAPSVSTTSRALPFSPSLSLLLSLSLSPSLRFDGTNTLCSSTLPVSLPPAHASKPGSSAV